MKKIRVQRIDNPELPIVPNYQPKPISLLIHKIELISLVMCQDRSLFRSTYLSRDSKDLGDKPLYLVRLSFKSEIAAPDIEIALRLATAYQNNKPLKGDNSIWYWNDKFWLKAVDNEGVSYYRNQCYALYEIYLDEITKNEVLKSIIT